jgi:hypothetical protein
MGGSRQGLVQIDVFIYAGADRLVVEPCPIFHTTSKGWRGAYLYISVCPARVGHADICRSVRQSTGSPRNVRARGSLLPVGRARGPLGHYKGTRRACCSL